MLFRKERRMKKFLTALLVTTLIVSMTACGNNAESNDTSASTDISTETSLDTSTSTEEIIPPTASTIGAKYLAAFSSSPTSTVGESVDELIELNFFDAGLVRMDVEEGYLNGFTEEIHGFTNGAMFSPMIGSIPFVGYVFESENPNDLLASLNACADPAWNVCTRADETVSFVKGNLVFFLMCSNEE